jgi:hypothetical protein
MMCMFFQRFADSVALAATMVGATMTPRSIETIARYHHISTCPIVSSLKPYIPCQHLHTSAESDGARR